MTSPSAGADPASSPAAATRPVARAPARRLPNGLALILATVLTTAAPAVAAPMVYEVSINGVPTGQIEEFDDRNGDLYASPAVLRRLGVKVDAAAQDAVQLSSIPELRYVANVRTQSLNLRLPPALLAARTLDGGRANATPRPSSDYGAVLNYELYADATWQNSGRQRSDAVSAFFNPRVFSPYGVVSASLIASPTNDLGGSRFRRLETYWSYGDYDDLVRYRVGDLVSSGLTWTRPVYMGGMQAITDFAMRPDLIATPVPLITGVANAPSTVDVLVNGVRQSSQSVDQGPFNITNLPIITGRGDVSIVVRDALGRETVQNFPYYVAAQMLREDLYAFGVEAGFVRNGYTGSDIDYGEAAGAATFRYGLSNWLTAEAHVEGARRLQNGGVGAILALGEIGQFNMAIAVSRSGGGRTGYQAYGAFERNLWSRSSNFFVSALQASSGYADLATLVGADPIRHQYRAGISFAPLGMGESVGFSATQIKTAGNDRFRLLAASVGLPVRDGINATLSGYKSLDPNQWQAMLTFNVQLGKRTTGFFSTGVEKDRSAYASADIFSYPSQEEGGLGWRLGGSIDRELNGRAYADVTWLGPVAAVTVGGARSGSNTGMRASISGAVVALDGVHLARDVNDGFAVVDTGAPDVSVRRGNVPVGRTGADGRLLVRNLISYNANKIDLDPDTLPVDMDVERLDLMVNPMDRSGVKVKFTTRKASASLLARITLPDGKPAPLGALLIADGGDTVGVGYDGLAWFTNVSGAERYILQDGARSCRIEIPAQAEADGRVNTRELPCR